MPSDPRGWSARGGPERSLRPGSVRSLSALLFGFLSLSQVPTASAHDGTGPAGLAQWHGTALVIVGVAILGGAVLLKRRGRIAPTGALYYVLFGLGVTVLGAIIFEGLAPDPTYSTSSMPFPRSWYPLLALSVGLLIAVASFLVGWYRWPTRPRYTFFGILMALWVMYPYLIPGPASDFHPLGYAIVLLTPAFVGYVIWKDAWGVLRAVLRDPVARRFGAGVGLLVGVFFLTVSGYVTFFPEAGAPRETVVAVLPVIFHLVAWPTLEVALPQIPLFVALSVGIVAIVGLLSALVGLNAAVIARHWRVESRAGAAEGTAGTAAVVGSCTCGCCGPLVAKVTVLAAGPSIAAPVYWIFVDTASPLSSLFIIGSIVLFTGSLVYSVESARDPDRSASLVPAD